MSLLSDVFLCHGFSSAYGSKVGMLRFFLYPYSKSVASRFLSGKRTIQPVNGIPFFLLTSWADALQLSALKNKFPHNAAIVFSSGYRFSCLQALFAY